MSLDRKQTGRAGSGLTRLILIGLVLGVFTGLFLGEYAAHLDGVFAIAAGTIELR